MNAEGENSDRDRENHTTDDRNAEMRGVYVYNYIYIVPGHTPVDGAALPGGGIGRRLLLPGLLGLSGGGRPLLLGAAPLAGRRRNLGGGIGGRR
jgi:hypothetical protein